ncbi:DUF4040 domain-containing protein [Paenimyroides tangerinum]|uniref:DUF4040 domain-containing protein n=1 Tax=Paenimyroides tangerinum TaxID=2488728 RepID=A0A3P3W505_9FLAO|nr:hydrogen gas-evolving membrane-bound hydrogenase subunit E [Paenimyroides tangerinum]RRJ90142.1 DUF4040 domain-containing protein [Paenimyroides tangerinum]
MLLLIISIFIIGFAILFLRPTKDSKYFKFLSILPFGLFLYFLQFIPEIQSAKKNLIFENQWIPSLGISLDFKIDGLSLLFSLLITGVGALIYFYASSYMSRDPYINRFYCYLTIFMGAMLGLVLSDNLISLFMFWELTSISSFFLIGFNTNNEDSRKSALWALSVTGLGGFFLLASFVMMNSITGTFSIQELFSQSEVLQSNYQYYVIIAFLFLGAFTKSAQFPFHFWLPGAMKAPTPVSAYLHSATMVKAGIYLLARFTPILSDGEVWNMVLMCVGGTTMVVGAFLSVFKVDMKSVLAYSTISALGILVFLIGIGTEIALLAASTFILVHALYKASFFMITGIVDHETHTRDLTVLSGLKKKLPIVAICAVIAALSSAGVPLTFGFISKEIIYGSTFDFDFWTYNSVLILTALVLITNVFLTSAGLLVGIRPFFGKLPEKFENIHKPDYKLWLPIVILSVFTLLFGAFPFIADQGIISAVTTSIYRSQITQELHLWHGWNTILLLSGATIVLGFILYFIIKPSHKTVEKFDSLNRIGPQNIISVIAENIKLFAFKYTRFFHNGYLRSYILFIIVFIIGIVGYKFFNDVTLKINTNDLSPFRIYEFVIFVLIISAIIVITFTQSRLTAIVSLGVVGLSICLIFVVYGAPDLAMTQFAIDTLTVVLFVLVLFKLPSFLKFSNTKNKIRDGIVSISFGILIALITLQALFYPSNKEVSKFYAENAYLLAKGKNVVNVILVDYRGIDTMIETVVLSIAAVGVLSILKYKSEDEETRE